MAICTGLSDCTKDFKVPGLQSGFTEQTFITTIIKQLLPVVLGIAGMIAVIMIVISGIQFITSGGNPEAANAAKNRLLYSIIGFVVIIFSFVALQIIDAIFLKSGIV